MLKKSIVFLSKKAEKQVKTLPLHIKEAVFLWVKTVEKIGLFETRKCSSYHDEPLKGLRLGQRSVRLNRAYRLFYEETSDKIEITIVVIEVNKHAY